MRVLLDTNILISYLLVRRDDSPIPAIIEAAVRGAYLLLLPQETVSELSQRVASKPYLRERIKNDELHQLLAILRPLSEVIPRIARFPAITRDAKDDYLLAYAVVGQADYLVTGDRDLLVLEEVQGVRIVTPRVFLSALE